VVTWEEVIEERAVALATFESLAGAQWDVQSLCGAWTVRQVLGHLVVAADPRLRHFALPFLRARGSFDTANDELARAEAARPIDELLVRYRERHTNRLKPAGAPLAAPYSDAMLHHLDVAVPLGLAADRPPERWVPVLGIYLSWMGAVGIAPRGRPKLRWVATDHDWSNGDGPEVHGSMADLALAVSGRAARLDQLTGPGQAAVARWLSG
jgi:uncharacterized protein (TIGR03083 family)